MSSAKVDPNKRKGGRVIYNKTGRDDKTYDNKYWKDKECYKYSEKGHTLSNCTNTKKDKYNDEKRTKTTRSIEIVKKLTKDVKKISKVFTMVKTQLQRIKKADSNLPDSEDEDEASHLQIANINFGKSNFQFAQLD